MNFSVNRLAMRGLASMLFLCTSAMLTSNLAAQFATSNMELTSHFPLNQIGGGSGADIWGWTDPTTSREYAIMNRTNGTAFVDVTDPYNSVYLGNLPTPTGSDTWRDVKTFGNYAYIVADGNGVGPHGMQIFDLTNLRGVTSPTTFTAPRDTQFRSAHNIAINEESGYAYVLGSDLNGGQAQVYNLNNTPGSPEYVGRINVDGYIHDAQIVNYKGPDTDYSGQEVMFSASANDLVLINVNDKSNPSLIWESQQPGPDPYPAAYVHQGWLSEDHSIFYQNDELDSNTWTHRWDVTDLDNPVYLGFVAPTVGSAIDHNLYVKGDYVYQANYTAGTRVFEITDAANATLEEVSWIDTHPENNGANFNGAWSVYPFFESGTIITSDINRGLFVTRVTAKPADFNADGIVDCTDIDQLTNAIANGTEQQWFDLNDDNDVDLADRDAWLVSGGAENLGADFQMGDINLDGSVNAADFEIWSQNKFTENASWCSGDLDGDGMVGGHDFLIWNQARAAAGTAAVPEPHSLLMMLIGALFYGRAVRRS